MVLPAVRRIGDHDFHFWRRHLRVGVLLSLLAVPLGVAYAAATWSEPHRTAIVAILLLVGFGSPGLLALPLERVLASGRGHWLFHAWTGSVVALATVLAVLDGGAGSPWTLLYALIVAYAATAYAPRAVALIVAAVLVCYLSLAVSGSEPLAVSLTFAGLLGLVGTMGAITAGNADAGRGALDRAHAETVRRLALAAEHRDTDTGGHIERMSRYCATLAARAGVAPERVRVLQLASALHDIGKIAIPDGILLKPGPLSEAERALMQEHARIGHEMLAGSGVELLDLAAEIALTHHERYDGSGYPAGLAGEAIPIEGRIAAIADVFDALTSDRVYRAAMPVDVALEIMARDAGSHFDPVLLDAFLDARRDVLLIVGQDGPALREVA
jgi:HD-GYP domain-containing protein (c-di-GMP phosphodiesterase class II)